MRKYRNVVGALSLTAVTLVGCGQVAETAIETATGSDIDVSDEGMTITGESGESMTIDVEGDTMTFTDEEQGLSVTTGTDVELPDIWPEGLPVPPADSIISVGDGGSGLIMISWSWGAMTVEDFDTYVAALESAGYTKQPDELNQDFGDDGFLRGVTMANATEEVFVNGQVMDGTGGISVSISPIG